MKLLFFGAGAIGAYIGGSLALTGCDVAFVERPGPAEILRREGLVLSLGAHTHRIPLNRVFTSAIDALRDSTPDLAVFALKSYDTGAAIEPLRALAGRLPPALCLQNGVENEAALEGVFGSGRVIAGTVTSAVGRGQEAAQIETPARNNQASAVRRPEKPSDAGSNAHANNNSSAPNRGGTRPHDRVLESDNWTFRPTMPGTSSPGPR